ncbi:MAG: plastocyanin/azurin family copper-binding protein [Xanthomonadales bacterium]|nr:plastocyanin/azurin family copper-binding protein [Xanthomonadales bacterium]
MDHPIVPITVRFDRRRLLTVGGAVFISIALGRRTDAHDPTPAATPASTAAGAKEASPAASPVASSDPTGPVFESPIKSLKFIPQEIDITAGTTVIWTNEDVVPHTVTHKVKLEDQLFASPMLLPGQTFTYTFEKPGTYPVYCLPHSFMTQKVVVSE